MSDEKSDICQSYDLETFKCVMLWDETAPFLDNMLKLGCYLGSSIYVGPVMTAKILMQNEQVLHRSMYRLLALDEIADNDGPDAKEQFMAGVHEKLGSGSYPEIWRTLG